jgi:hypothetical protein
MEVATMRTLATGVMVCATFLFAAAELVHASSVYSCSATNSDPVYENCQMTVDETTVSLVGDLKEAFEINEITPSEIAATGYDLMFFAVKTDKGTWEVRINGNDPEVGLDAEPFAEFECVPK